MKLSTTQQRALTKLRKRGSWQSSFDIKESLATMQSLRRMGLVKAKGYGTPGHIFSPQTVLEWKATD